MIRCFRFFNSYYFEDIDRCHYRSLIYSKYKSIRKFALDLGVSASFVCAVLNSKKAISDKLLSKWDSMLL